MISTSGLKLIEFLACRERLITVFSCLDVFALFQIEAAVEARKSLSSTKRKGTLKTTGKGSWRAEQVKIFYTHAG